MAHCIYSGARVPVAKGTKSIRCPACDRQVEVTVYEERGRQAVARVHSHDDKEAA